MPHGISSNEGFLLNLAQIELPVPVLTLLIISCSPVKGGVNAKELFHGYITIWIKEKRVALLELCKPDKVHYFMQNAVSRYFLQGDLCWIFPNKYYFQVKWSSMQTAHSTTPFVDDIYSRVKETLNEYDIIISRWPEYTIFLESVCSRLSLCFVIHWCLYLFSGLACEQAIADVEKAVVESLEKQYADVLSPLKDYSMPIKIGLKYVQKFAKGTVCPYVVSSEVSYFLWFYFPFSFFSPEKK